MDARQIHFVGQFTEVPGMVHGDCFKMIIIILKHTHVPYKHAYMCHNFNI